ncbi:DUF2790 domain-containing protein [Pseudomonas silvicola]|nr:DUF2790 domain-containing protein [Pseudomonas silvicola]
MNNSPKVLLQCACLVLAVAAGTPLATAGEYHYSDTMDIAKVVSIDTPTSPTCKVVTSTMRYIDSTGAEKTVEFRQLADSCTASD